MANPPGSHQEPIHGRCSINGNGSNGNSAAMDPESSAGKLFNPDVAVDWTADEQAVLEDALTQYASEPNVIRYAKIAMLLPSKTVRDVAMRCMWMTKKASSKRRKKEHNLTGNGKEKKERVADHSAQSSHSAVHPNALPNVLPEGPNMGNGNGIPFEDIGGPIGELLKQNARALDQIYENIHSNQVNSHQILENINLFCQARNNLRIMNEFTNMPDIMMQMPPLPVQINEELANNILLMQL